MASTSTSIPGNTNPTMTAVEAGYGAVSISPRTSLNASYWSADERNVVRRRTESSDAPWARRTSSTLARAWRNWASNPSGSDPSGRNPAWPEATMPGVNPGLTP